MDQHHTINGFPVASKFGGGDKLARMFELIDPRTSKPMYTTTDLAECLDVTNSLKTVTDTLRNVSDPEAVADLIVSNLRVVMASLTKSPEAVASATTEE